jgi:hypothetical protein
MRTFFRLVAPLAGTLFAGLISWFSPWPDGNVPSSQLTEHRGIASAARPHVALSGRQYLFSVRQAATQ